MWAVGVGDNSTVYFLDTTLAGTMIVDSFANGTAIAESPGSTDLGQLTSVNG